MNDPIREAFERITAPAFVFDPNTRPARKPNGEYIKTLLEDHWQTFQEGWEAAIESTVKVLDALDKVNGKQEELGPEFSKVLHDNLWDLYSKDENETESPGAFVLGVRARKNGDTVYSCPYVKAKQPYEYRQWFAGYDAVRFEE